MGTYPTQICYEAYLYYTKYHSTHSHHSQQNDKNGAPVTFPTRDETSCTTKTTTESDFGSGQNYRDRSASPPVKPQPSTPGPAVYYPPGEIFTSSKGKYDSLDKKKGYFTQLCKACLVRKHKSVK